MRRLKLQWVNDFKVALINENIEMLSKLLDEVPDFKNKQDAKEALALISQAYTLLNNLKKGASIEMSKIRKTKAFIKSL